MADNGATLWSREVDGNRDETQVEPKLCELIRASREKRFEHWFGADGVLEHSTPEPRLTVPISAKKGEISFKTGAINV